MWGKDPPEELQFDPAIERTTRRNNSKNSKKKLQENLKHLEESYISKQETMVDMKDNNNANNGNNNGGMSYVNSLRCLQHIDTTQKNVRQMKMKVGLLQILHVYPFEELDNKDPYTHLTIFMRFMVC